jgi:magnesium transporter
VLADVIKHLPIEHQVVVFRISPRRLAGSAFEFLELADQEPLLKAMGQEDVSAVLDHMAPDDRTALFEELPASVTKRLMGLLSRREREVAVTFSAIPQAASGAL